MVFTPLRDLPDVDDVLLAVLGGGEVVCGANVPADLAERLKPAGSHYVAAHRFGGAAVHPEFLDRATVEVDSWSASRRTAESVAQTCRVLLYGAWRSQQRHAGASISRYLEVTAPAELPTGSQSDGLYRFGATYSLHIRP